MSDQKPTIDEAQPKEATPVGKAKPGEAGKLEARPMTLSQQVFLWTMVVLVGGVFGVGSSFGLLFTSNRTIGDYQVDSSVVARRQRTAETLQAVIAPNSGYYGPRFAKGGPEAYAQLYRISEFAADRGLKPSGKTVDDLVSDFLARTIDGRTYGDKLRDDRRGAAMPTEDLQVYLAEEFAVSAWQAREIIPPVMPLAQAGLQAAIIGDRVPVDEVLLTATTLLPEVAADDPELQADYERLLAQGRFQKPAMLVLQVAHADLEPLIAAQAIDDAAVAAYYEAHLDEFRPASDVPDQGQTQVVSEPRPLDEVREEIRQKLARTAAQAAAGELITALDREVVDQGLEEKGAEEFASAAVAAGLKVTEVEIADPGIAAIDLGAPFGSLGRTARDIGLGAGKPGSFISDRQRTPSGDWLMIRYRDRLPESRRALDDPEVAADVRRHLAGRRAYAGLLAEAEALRAKALEVGGLRALFADQALAERWSTSVTRSERRVYEPLEAPEPADEGAARPEPRIAASLAVAGNPVAVVAESPDRDVPRVRLVQGAGYLAGKQPEPDRRGDYAEDAQQMVARVLQSQAYESLQRQLGE